MSYDDFILTIESSELPPNLPLYLQALWYDAKDNWSKAHSLIDASNDADCCWVHAYLHRKEGDVSNADYWYRRAGKQRPAVSVQDEWKQITMLLILK